MENARCTLHDSKRDKSLLLSMIKKKYGCLRHGTQQMNYCFFLLWTQRRPFFKHFCLFMSKYNSFPFAGFNH